MQVAEESRLKKIDRICSTDISANVTINTRYVQAFEVCTETCSGSPNACGTSSTTAQAVSKLPTIGSGYIVPFDGLLDDTLCYGGIHNKETSSKSQ